MIIVSGMPRCGSSLMMQTLKHLGVPLVGEDSFDFKGNSYLHSQAVPQEDQDNITKHNPQGYYDIPFEFHPLFTNSHNQGQAIKLLGPVSILPVPLDYVEHVMICTRNSLDNQALSYMKLAKLDVEIMDKEILVNRMDPLSVRAKTLEYYRHMELSDFKDLITFGQESIDRWWSESNRPYTRVVLEDILKKPTEKFSGIQKALGLKGSIEKALTNVRN